MKIMSKALLSLLSTLAAASIMIACAGGRVDSSGPYGNSQVAGAELRNNLDTADSLEREDPFVARPFDPRFDDRWIGHAVAYGCYRRGQAPGERGPDEAEILADMRIIADHWNLIRVYGADSDTLRVLQAIDRYGLPIKVLLGLWLTAEESDPKQKEANARQVRLGVELANRYPEIVIAISVGDETQVSWSAHRMPAPAIIEYIRAVRANVAVPVTTADDYLFWNKPESRQVALEIDFIVTHIHPLWNGKTLDSAISWMDGVYHDLCETHPDRKVILGETGWATDYDRSRTGPGEQGTLVMGEVGLPGQASFLVQLADWVDSSGVTTFIFEAFDEPWKGGGDTSAPNHIVAFYAGRVDECYVDDELVTPQPGNFYGGWITRNVVGPFKGVPNSTGW